MNDLAISLDGTSKTPLYEQIYRYIKHEIQTGGIKSGDKLPSTRALCRYLDVSRSTVELAYEQLISEGYLESEACRGFFAADVEGLYQLERPSPVHPEIDGQKRILIPMIYAQRRGSEQLSLQCLEEAVQRHPGR